MPKFSLRTDNGGEFKNEFEKYLKTNHILHRVSLPYRHKQNANVENVNNILGRILMTYLQNKEMETQQPYNEWTDILPILRTKLNEIRKKPNGDPYNTEPILYNQFEPKFKVGDIVIAKYEIPHNALGNKESTTNWRKGDTRWNLKEHRKIIKVLNYPNNTRYILNDLPNVSYAETEIKISPEKQELREVKKIIGHRYKGASRQYQIWFKGKYKKDAIWIKKKDLPNLIDEIKEYENNIINE